MCKRSAVPFSITFTNKIHDVLKNVTFEQLKYSKYLIVSFEDPYERIRNNLHIGIVTLPIFIKNEKDILLVSGKIEFFPYIFKKNHENIKHCIKFYNNEIFYSLVHENENKIKFIAGKRRRKDVLYNL